MQLMARQHSVATTSQARALGLSRRAERGLIDRGIIAAPFPGVLAAAGAPVSFEGRAMSAALGPGVMAVAHGAAARLHGLDGFDRHDVIDVIGVNGAAGHASLRARFHQTRGPVADHVVEVAGIPVLSVALTLTLLAPIAGIGPTARALDSALRDGVSMVELRDVARSWRQRGRSGPPALLMLLGERVDRRLPRSWFQRIAKRVLERSRIRLVDEYPVRDERGILLAELDLADPVRRVGVECQSWEWHGSPEAQHRDARRRGALRQLGWEIVDVWWSDLRHPDRVLAELTYLLESRTPNCTALRAPPRP
jgi:hypothetical protein